MQPIHIEKINIDQVTVLFPDEIVKKLPTEWTGDLFDFLNRIATTSLEKLNHLLYLASHQVMKCLPSIHTLCNSVIPELILLNKKDAQQNQIIIPTFYDRHRIKAANDIKLHRNEAQPVLIDAIHQPLAYVKYLLSYLRTIYPFHHIRTFHDECNRQYQTYHHLLTIAQ